MLFKLMKKWKKIVFYELNIIFAFIFLTKLIFIRNIQYIHIYYMILHLNCILYFPKML